MKKISLIFLCAFISIKAQEPTKRVSQSYDDLERDRATREAFFAAIDSRAQEPRDPEIRQGLQEAAQKGEALKIEVQTLQARANFCKAFLPIDNPEGDDAIDQQELTEKKQKALEHARREVEVRLNKADISDTEKTDYNAQLLGYFELIIEREILKLTLQKISSRLKKVSLQKE